MKLLQIFCVVCLFFGFSVPIYGQNSQNITIKTAVPLSPEFTYLVSRNSTISIDHQQLTVHLAGGINTKMIGHKVKMNISGSEIEFFTFSDSNSNAVFDLSGINLSPGKYIATFTDQNYSRSIKINDNYELSIPGQEIVSVIYLKFFQFIEAIVR